MNSRCFLEVPRCQAPGKVRFGDVFETLVVTPHVTTACPGSWVAFFEPRQVVVSVVRKITVGSRRRLRLRQRLTRRGQDTVVFLEGNLIRGRRVWTFCTAHPGKLAAGSLIPHPSAGEMIETYMWHFTHSQYSQCNCTKIGFQVQRTLMDQPLGLQA